jgi:A/G-specific adenine glycosylase
MLNKNFFVSWFKKRGRSFPWRIENIPPFISLVTEMLLRQTRAAAVAKLWEDFFSKYSSPYLIVTSKKEELYEELKILGFGNQRVESLVLASNWLLNYHNGEVPKKLEQLLAIPHVGDYAARAVQCFAFNQRIEIVDVNIQRFYARYYGLEVKPDVRRNPHIWKIAQESLPAGRKRTQQHNYGLLDFTAEICVSGRPLCEICPLVITCAFGSSQAISSKKKVA